MELPEELLEIIKSGEGINAEFKKSTYELPKSICKTVCSFSNRDGGHIFLGVKSSGNIVGIQPICVERIKKELVASLSDESKMSPPLYLSPVEYEYNGKTILYIYVPSSPSVERYADRIYDRNCGTNLDITNNDNLVYQLYARKQSICFVNKVYPEFKVSDLRQDLIDRVRQMAGMRCDNHPWLEMNGQLPPTCRSESL